MTRDNILPIYSAFFTKMHTLSSQLITFVNNSCSTYQQGFKLLNCSRSECATLIRFWSKFRHFGYLGTMYLLLSIGPRILPLFFKKMAILIDVEETQT